MASIKIITLNIHHYRDFTKRKPKIIALIQRYKPDIMALQEVRDDKRKNKVGMNQLNQLNKKLKFKYFRFLRVNNINKVKGIHDAPSCYEGLAILSKFPFSSSEFTLKKHNDDKYQRKILMAHVRLQKREFPFWVVHFSNNDLFAQLHAKETLYLAKSAQPIIIGDFNIRYPKEIRELAEKNSYVSSSEYKYISFPEDHCSYDYIFIPAKYSFLRFECIPAEVSDHKALFAEIKL